MLNRSCHPAVGLLGLKFFAACTLALGFAGHLFAAEGTRPAKTAAELDWITADQLPDGVDLGHCSGLYRAPRNDSPEAGLEPAESPLRSSADESEIRQNREVTLSGDVYIEEGYRRLSADEVTYNKDTEQLKLEGDLLLREPGLTIRAGQATINSADGSGSLSPADYVLHQHHVRGGAEEIARLDNGLMQLSRASYTHCEPNNNAWFILGKRIIINQEAGTGTVHHARLNIKGVPVFYSPWLQFPIDDRRKTGLLWPSYANTSSGGIDFAVPYYINLAPNYDLTITPRYISNRGLVGEVEGRFMNRYGQWVVGGSYLDNEENTNRDRWLFTLGEQGQIGRNFRTRIDFTRVSDDDFFNDLSARGLEVKRQTHLDQLGEILYSSTGWKVAAKLQQFQTIETSILPANEPYRLLPRISVSRNTLALPFQPTFDFQMEYTYFDHDVRTRGHRLYAEPEFSYPMEWLAGYIKPSIKLKHASYFIDEPLIQNSDDEEEYTVPVFQLDTGLIFERDAQLGESTYTQTLEPRLFYLNVPEQDQSAIPLFDTTNLTFGYDQLFRDDRFTGNDRVGDANQLTLGVTTRFIDEQGVEKFSASVGQIFYFEDRLVISNSPLGVDETAATSEVAGELEYRPTDHLRLTSSMLWNTQANEINEGGFQFQYEPEDDVLINLAYRYRRDNPFNLPGIAAQGETIEQTDFSAVFPFGKHWRAYLRWQYNITEESTIEDLVGLEYSDCCWDIRVVYQRGLNGVFEQQLNNPLDFEVRREHAVYVQFVLRGLGGFGDKIDRILDRSILGYRDFRRNFR